MSLANQNITPKIQPQKFALWLGIVSIIMLFAALTSAFIVRRSAGNWETFRMPTIFWFSTLTIMLSSATMHWAVVSFKKFKYDTYKIAITLTFILGCIFILLQYEGWLALQNIGIYINGNPSGSFLYVISMAHATHVIGGIIVLLFAMIKSFTKSYNPNRIKNISMTATYWHFVDILWVYLFIFFQFNLS
jgi:cytochrome c oxidase subunit III